MRKRTPAAPTRSAPATLRDYRSVWSDYPHVTIDIVDLTPSIASGWLKRYNKHNRTERPRAQANFIRDMRAGSWALNGATIVFAGTPDDPELLLDGQNRLRSVEQSGVAIHTVVIWGIDPSAQDTQDIGTKRTGGDRMHLQGESNATLLNAALGWQWREDIDRLASKISPTPAEVEQTLSRHPSIRQSCSFISSRRLIGFPPRLAVFLHHKFAGIDQKAADEFMERTLKGVRIDQPDPEWKLNRLVASKRPDELTIMALTIKAWNARRENKPVRVLKWGSNEDMPEPV